MKNRKTVVMAFLLVAVMLIGVGYAALTDSLEIEGTSQISKDAAQNAFDFDVYFASAVANRTGDTAEVLSTNNDKVSFTINNFATEGDTASFTFTVQNDSDLNARIVDTTLTNNSTIQTDDQNNVTTLDPSLFTVTYDWSDELITADGGTQTVTVTVTLNETPQFAIKGSFNLTVSVVSEEV